MRDAFPRAVALCFLAAFASAYTQWPGLFGAGGLEPADAWLRKTRNGAEHLPPAELYRQAPTLAWFAPALGLSVDALNEATALAGAAAAFAAAAGPLPHGLLLAACYVLYLSLYLQGQSFLSFQWDILLLETGVVAAAYAPWSPLPRSRRAAPAPLVWTARLVLFKLMLMAGVVKLQAECPTWTDLTALNFHYATQCIPNRQAWLAHQLPPLVQQVSVAATLYIEIIAPFFIIAPFRLLRKVAVAQQLLLQALIVLTGNYNFFSFLTAALCLPLLDDAEPEEPAEPGWAGLERLGPVLWVQGALRRLEARKDVRAALWAVVALSVALPAYLWLTVSIVPAGDGDGDGSWLERVQLRAPITPPMLHAFLEAVLPPALVYALLALVLSSAAALARSPVWRLPRTLAAIGIALALFGVNLVPWIGLHRPLQARVPEAAIHAYTASQRWHVVSGYGLFRRMTGMAAGEQPAFGQLPLSVVARPEVNLHGTADGETWHEIPFRYKPGAVDAAPRWIAPHQARLDWQMWFAALGSYQSQPWIVHLVDRLLEGAPDVVRLLDADHYPFSSDAPPVRIRCDLYHYDFTRYNTSWARRLPNSELVEPGDRRWWTQTRVGEYLPEVGRGDPALQQFIEHHGWARGAAAEPLGVPLLEACRGLADALEPHQVVWAAVGVAVAVRSLLSFSPVAPVQARRRRRRRVRAEPEPVDPEHEPVSRRLRRRRPRRGEGVQD